MGITNFPSAQADLWHPTLTTSTPDLPSQHFPKHQQPVPDSFPCCDVAGPKQHFSLQNLPSFSALLQDWIFPTLSSSLKLLLLTRHWPIRKQTCLLLLVKLGIQQAERTQDEQQTARTGAMKTSSLIQSSWVNLTTVKGYVRMKVPTPNAI